MGVEIDPDSVEGVTVGVAHGPLTLKEIKDSAVRMWQRVEGPKVRILWDLREAQFDLGSNEVQELAEFVNARSPYDDLRTAFVVSRDLAFGLVRMFEAFREQGATRVSVFRERAPALEWLVRDGV